jgi:hypothetical protein
MSLNQQTELRELKAFDHAIKVVGFATFKATSLFASNRTAASEKKAA